MVSYRLSLQENMFLHFSCRFSANPWHILQHNSHSCTQAIDSEADDQQPKDATSKASHGEMMWKVTEIYYPLVNVYVSMENHHFSWENSIFLWPFSIAILTEPEGIGFF